MSSQVQERDERLFAFFDGELDESERASVEAELAGDESLAATLADLSFMREMVVGDLERQAERVPEARFEQLWDNFEATLDRESRLQEAAEDPPALWQRMVDWLRPARVPLAAVAAAGVLAFVFARGAGSPEEVPGDGEEVASNTPEQPASDQPASDSGAATAPAPELAPQPAPKLAPSQVALAPSPTTDDQEAPEMFPQPEPGEAEIRRIEFGGQSGSISQVESTRGTTTVIWVVDEDPVDSERSL